jgi:FkbM family methyltransferase
MESTPRNYEVLVQETYEAILSDGDVAIDVGAHQGRHCIPMAERVFPHGKVLAFEPLPICRKMLDKEVTAYYPELAGVLKVYPYALSDFTGTTEFVVAKDALAYSGLKERQYDWPTELERIPIEVKRLDDLCLDLPSLRFLKIDAEGGEYHILKGAVQTLRKFRPAVAFEFGVNSIAEYRITPAEMARFWTEQRYKIYGIIGNYLRENDFVASAEAQTIWDYVAVPAEDTVLESTVARLLAKPPDWHRVTTHLDAADYNANLVGGIPPLIGFHGLKQWLVKRIAGLVSYGTKLITSPQRACNRSLLRSLRALLKLLRDREAQAAKQANRAVELEGVVCALSQRLQLQQDQLTRLTRSSAERDAQLAEMEKAFRFLPGAEWGEYRSDQAA